MKKMYHSKPGGVFLRIFSVFLALSLVFEVSQAAEPEPPKIVAQTFSIEENAVPGSWTREIVAENAASYTIIGGNAEGFFLLDEATGLFSLSEDAVIDYETLSTFELTVQVSNDAGADQAEITINVLDILPPTASTGDAADITEKKAVLSGSFNDNGAVTVAAIQYGTDQELDDEFDPEDAEGSVSIAAGAGETGLTLELDNLQAGTTYYYRTVAKSVEGVVRKEVKSFTTLTIPWVEEIAVRDQNPTNANFVSFLVTFTEDVAGVDLSDFELEIEHESEEKHLSADLDDLSIVNDRQYIVQISSIDGDGTLKLVFRDNGTVKGKHSQVSIGGEGVGSGDFEGSEIYTIDQTPPELITLIYTNEDVPVSYGFAVSNAPDDPNDLIFSFNSSNKDLVGDESYEVLGTGTNRRVRIIPSAHVHGETLITLRVKDGSTNVSEPKELKVVVRAVADTPLMVANNVSGDEDTEIPLDLSVSLVDMDDSEVLESIEISGVPTGTSLTAGIPAGNGVFTFTDATQLRDLKFLPALNEWGVYELSLTATARETEPDPDFVTKEKAKITKTFSVTVNPINDEPVFTLNPTDLTLDEDFEGEKYISIIPEQMPADEQDQVVSYEVKPLNETETPIATVRVANDESGKPRVVIEAIENANGTQEFAVIADDGQPDNNTHEEIFTLTINPSNDLPVFALEPSELELEEDFEEEQYVSIIAAEVPADEADQLVNYTVEPKDSELEPVANVEMVTEDGINKLKITAIPDANGTQVFTITANDGQDVNNFFSREFKLTVTAVNDKPVFVLDPSTVEDEEDFEGTHIVKIIPAPVPADEQDQQVSYSMIQVNPEQEAVASVELIDVSGNAPYFNITSIPDANGEIQIIISAKDTQGGVYSDTLTIIINPVDDAPAFTLSDTEIIRDEDFEETIEVTIVNDSPENESDQTIVYSIEPDPATVDFANVSIDAATGTITITSVPDGFGSQEFTVIAHDGEAAHEEGFVLIVNPVNDAPAFTLSETEVIRDEDFTDTITITVAEDSPENESDQDIAYSLSPASVDFANVSIDAATGEITITSVPNGFGRQEFTVIADDGQNENNIYEETFVLIVNPVNDGPLFSLSDTEIVRDEDFTDTITITIAEDSPENEEETITYSLSPESVDFANVSIDAATGTITITSVPDGFGRQEFTVIAHDGEAAHEEAFVLIVNPVNDAPAFTLSDTEVIRDENFTDVITITIAEDSPENEEETITYSLSPESVDFANVSIDAATGEIIITSVPDRFGRQEFTVIAHDGQEASATHEESFTLIVNPVNNPPVFTLYPEEVVVYEDFTTTETVVPALSESVFGEEDETVVFSLRNADIDWANVSIDPATGIVTITAVPDGTGERMIEVVATDNGHPAPAEYVQTFLLRVIPVNDAPALAGELEDQVINEDELWEYTIPAGIFTDPDGDETLAFTATLLGGETLPAWLSFDAAAKTFSGTPDGPDVGDYQILVTATDEDGEQIRNDFKLTVVPVNDVPVISEIDDVTVDLGDPVPSISFTISDEETPASELIVTVTTDNEALLPASSIRLTGEGEDRVLELMPPFEEWGSALVTVTVSDGEAEVQEQFTFTVNFQELALDIPDLITPNDDGANDTWNIRYLTLYENNDIRVFDRTGKLVFQARNYSEGREWDGTHNGRRLPEGVYYYEIKLNSGAVAKRGTVTIAR